MVKLDITLGFEPRIPGSSPGEGTLQQAQCKQKNMNKKFLLVVLFCLVSIIFIPSLATAAEWVTCGNGPNPTACTLDDFKTTLATILSFLVDTIAIPLATLAIIVGGILMMTSAGNANLLSIGKKTFWSAVIGLTLALGAKVIINFVLDAIGSGSYKIT